MELDVNERSITHKIAEYLQRDFRTEGYDVDCEYNRNGHDPKTLSLEPWSTKSDSLEGDTVYPDIIIHKRESPTNLVVIEAKKSTNKVNFRDLQKLKAFRRELGYRLCYSLTLYVREDFKRTRLYEMREITA